MTAPQLRTIFGTICERTFPSLYKIWYNEAIKKREIRSQPLMKNSHQQKINTRLIKKTTDLRHNLGYFPLKKRQMSSFFHLLKKEQNRLMLFGIFIIVETFLGISLPLFSHFYLDQQFDLFQYQGVLVGIPFLLLGIGIYLFTSYRTLLLSKRISLDTTNTFRKSWYAHFLNHSPSATNIPNHRPLTKIIYHTLLLRTGFENILNEGARITILYASIFLFCFLFNTKLFLISIGTLPLIGTLGIIGYLISKKYLAREQTFNSKIVEEVNESIVNFQLIKNQQRETEKLKTFENILELDAFFRVRRELWMSFFDRILFIGVLLFGIILYLIQTYWGFIDLNSITSLTSSSFIIAYLTRIIFAAGKIGMYSQIFITGLKLGVPDFSTKRPRFQTPFKNSIIISSQKTKLARQGSYLKKFKLEIKKGDKILIYTPEPLGKTTLAQAITGLKMIPSLVFTIDDQRYHSKRWNEAKIKRFLIQFHPTFKTTLGEFLFGKPPENISAEEFSELTKKLPSELFQFLFHSIKILGTQLHDQHFTATESCLLQIAHCLMSPKNLIVVDHMCLDLKSKEVISALNILTQKSPHTTFIFFSKEKNTYLPYQHLYELHADNLEKK